MHIALLAAGTSRRMRGRDKLLEDVAGEALLTRLARAALAARCGPVAVTLPEPPGKRAAALAGMPVTRLSVPDSHTGMSASLRAAARWARGHPLMLCPADMPELSASDFATMAHAYEDGPLRGTAEDGTPGHPVVFPPALLPLFDDLTGDEGARTILQAHPPRCFALPARHAVTDLDTPEEWAAWRAMAPR